VRVAAVTPEQIDFPFAAQVLALRAVVTKKKTGECSDETRLFATSLLPTERTPSQLMRLCRGHWGVEAGNHNRRDVTWGEDRTSGRNARRALNIALVRTALLGPLLGEGSINLRALSQAYSANPGAAIRRLLHPHFDG
jgi:predicted transposase YbfD/YdcC